MAEKQGQWRALTAEDAPWWPQPHRYGESVLTDPEMVAPFRQALADWGYTTDDTPLLTQGERGLICLLLGIVPRQFGQRKVGS